MKKYFSEKAESISPYVPGEQPKDGVYIKLNTNENPYPPSEKVKEAIRNADLDRLRLYREPEATELRETYAKVVGVEANNVFVGNGSDEVLATAFQAFFMGRDKVVMPDISYSFYPVYCQLYDIDAEEIALEEDYSIDIKKYYGNNNGVVICNPNAPTSKLLSQAEIEEIINANADCVVIVDEAYAEFGNVNMIPLIKKYDNLLVVRTLSKSYALAGLRVGFAVGSEALIDGMNRIKNSFNSYPIDMIAQTAAKAAVEDQEYLSAITAKVIATRDRTKAELRESGFIVCESGSNFLFVSNPEKAAEEIFNKLKERKILVRYFNKPRLNNYLRVSIGTDEEMDSFIREIKDIVNSDK